MGVMTQTPAPVLHHQTEADIVVEGGPSQNEGGGQQLIGWRLLLCFSLGAGLWWGVVRLLAAVLPESGMTEEILSVARLVILFVGVASLCLAGLVGLNEILRRVGPGKSRSSWPGSPTSRPSGAGGRLS